MEQVGADTLVGRLLNWCQDQGASDLHAQAGRPYRYRVDGKLSRIPTELFAPLSTSQIQESLRQAFSPDLCQRIQSQPEVDCSFSFGSTRYRANFSKQQGEQSFSFRFIPRQSLTPADLRLPPSLLDFSRSPRGLVLLTGPTGQGKSTTARALIQEINLTQPVRIITIEDPIEYVFEEDQAQFEQREVGIDTPSFATGIRNAMRQDPNVLFVGEIRDKESIYTAMQAAETGHLVITTLHADSAAQAIGRIREFYPAAEQPGISSLLARNLNMLACQRLIPSLIGPRIPCLEILRRDPGIIEAIQTNELHRLLAIVESASGQGMHSFDQYIMELMAEGLVDQTTARLYSVNKHRLDMTLRGILTQQSILNPDNR